MNSILRTAILASIFVCMVHTTARADEIAAKDYQYGAVENKSAFPVNVRIVDIYGKDQIVELKANKRIILPNYTKQVEVYPHKDHPLDSSAKLNVNVFRADDSGGDRKSVPGFWDTFEFDKPTGSFPPAYFVRDYDGILLDGACHPDDMEALSIKMLEHKDSNIRIEGACGLQNSKNEKAVVPLAKALNEIDNSTIRREAAKALGSIGSKQAVTVLERSMLRTLDDSSIRVYANALAGIGSEDALSALKNAANSEYGRLSGSATQALYNVQGKEAIPYLKKLIEDKNFGYLSFAISALGEVGGEPEVKVLQGLLNDNDFWTQRKAIEALVNIGGEEALKTLRETLRSDDSGVRWATVNAISNMEREDALAFFHDALQDDSSRARAEAADALSEMKDSSSVGPLIKALKDKDPRVRNRAAWALGQLKSEEAVSPLIELLKDENKFVRDVAVRALGEIGSKEAREGIGKVLNDKEYLVRESAKEALGMTEIPYLAEPEEKQNPKLLELNKQYLEDKAWLKEAEPDSEEAKKRRQRLNDAAKQIEDLMQQEKQKHGEDWLDNYRDKDGKLPGGFLEDNKSRLTKLKEKQADQKEKVETLQEKFERLKAETRDADETFEERLLKDQRAYKEAFIKEHGDPSQWTDEERAEYERGFNGLKESSRQAWEKDRKANSEKMRELGRTIKELSEAKVNLEGLEEAAKEMEKMIADENAFKEPLLYDDFFGIPQIPTDINETAERIKSILIEPVDEKLLKEAETELLEKEDEVAAITPEEKKDVEEKPEEDKDVEEKPEGTKEEIEWDYFNDFEGYVGREWSRTLTDKTPRGNRGFLGQFGNETITLKLQAQKAGAITLTFDLFIINSWDGNHTYMNYGPERWKLSVSGGPILLDTSFSNLDEYTNKQSYPDNFGKAEHPAVTGAAEKDTLGYPFYGDSVYKLTYTFQHDAGDVVIAFSGVDLQGLGDESWGLDNVRVKGACSVQDQGCMSVFKEFSAEVNKRYKLMYQKKEGIGKSGQKIADVFNEIFKGDCITAFGIKTREELDAWDKALMVIFSFIDDVAIGAPERDWENPPEPNVFMGKKIFPGSIEIKKFDEEGFLRKTEPVYHEIWNATKTIERAIIELRNKHAEFKVRTQEYGKEEGEKDYKESLKILLDMQKALEEHTEAMYKFRGHTFSMVGILNKAYDDYTYSRNVRKFELFNPKALENNIKRAANNCKNSYNEMKASLKKFSSFFVEYQSHVWNLQDICQQ